MFETIKRNKGFFIIAFVVLLILAIVLFLLNRAGSQIEIMRTTPTNNQERVSTTSPVRVTLNRLPDDARIILSPAAPGTLTTDRRSNTIAFTPNTPLDALTEYTVTFSFESLSENTSNVSYSWNFTTDQESYGESFLENNPTPAEQFRQNLKRAENAFTERKRRLPFIIYLPYETPTFKVEIMATSDTVTVTTFGNSPATHQQYREEALDWIRTNGGNPQNFTLRYVPDRL